MCNRSLSSEFKFQIPNFKLKENLESGIWNLKLTNAEKYLKMLD